MSLEQQIQECTAAIKALTEALQQGIPTPVEPAKEPVKAAKAKKEPLKVVPEPVKEEKAEPAEVVEEAPAKDLTIEDVRAVLTPLVANHNPLIAETIKSLGGTTLSSLDASKYQQLIDTINAKIAG